jgi:hypothetical protein
MAAAEQKKSYAVIKQFKGIDTKANRTAIDRDEFSWLENAMPVGSGNLRIVPAYDNLKNVAGNNVVFSNVVTYLTNANIKDEYLIASESDGSMEAFDLNSNTLVNIASAGTFSGANVSAAQYQNTDLFIGDPNKGLYQWNGANVIAVGSIGLIGITNPGAGYTAAPSVVISAPDNANGTQATAVATITTGAGGVLSIQVLTTGSGYTSVPTVTISAPDVTGGNTAIAAATISGGNVVAISVVSPGSGYLNTPSVSITGGGGSSATANATLSSGVVNSITLTEAGSGYVNQPTVTIRGGGASINATAIAELVTFATGTVSIAVTNGGTGYGGFGNLPVTIVGGGGSGANATAIISGNTITEVIMNNHGTGYTSSPLVFVSGGTGSNATLLAVVNTAPIVDVATFSGRVWIAQGRTVYASSAVSPTDFTSVSAVSLTLTDSTLTGNITALLSANNFLYVYGEDSINVFSNLQVTSTGNTLFTNTNVSASIGSKRLYAIFPYFRSVLFMNDYGIYALVGSTTTKISDPLDGIFPYIDFTKPVTGGQALLNNILCAVFNFYVNSNFPLGPSPSRYIQCVFFEKKWFITSQGNTLKYVTSAPVNGKVNLYGTDTSNYAYQLYSNSINNISSYIQTALQDMGDPIRTKQALKFAVEATLTQSGTFDVTVDSEQGASSAYTLADTGVSWLNNNSQVISWVNNSSVVINWLLSVGYYLYKSDASQYGKYLGLTMTSNNAGFVVNTFEFEHELRVRF